jgi:hypothetical protein
MEYFNKKRRNKMKQGNNNINFGRPTNLQQSFAPNILPGVQPKDLTPGICNNCGGNTFVAIVMLGIASRFQTQNGQPTLVQFPRGFMCTGCDAVNPFEEKKEEEVKEGTDLSINTSDGIKTEEKLR